uniref:TSA: Wollemia nobilis Ref_Wollemi_Transcript_2485_883 transcribed RNA sequence n=1 Tax=Wollemia nobilis TaxID=56998 RepID=A0A0C9RYR4_9CONI
MDFFGMDLPPSDDDSWLYNGEEDLNAALLERQKEMDLYETERLKRKQSKNPKGSSSTSKKNMDDFNLDDVAKNMHAFVEKMSSYEGAEVPRTGNSETVSLDMGQFLKELKSAMGDDTANKDLTSQEEYADGSEYSSSDMDCDGTEIDSSEAVENGEEVNMTKETEGPTDAFMEEYSNALNKQLKNSTLTKSFVHTENPSTSEDTNKLQTHTGGNKDDDLMPVDIDFNLVQNLLDSFSSQQGMPGPASNILGLMGLQLPDDSKTG